MISHKHKCIFIHIPKCAGTSINKFLADGKPLSWKEADYDLLHGWCPKRKFFMQHATAKQMLETELVTEEQWNTYYKFTFVRNPYDRAVSDYFWLQKDQNVKGSFKNYFTKSGAFKKYLNNVGELYYRGDHLLEQTSFYDVNGPYSVDYVGKFETIDQDIAQIISNIGMGAAFNVHMNKAKKEKKHYSLYFTNSNKQLADQMFANDLNLLAYTFEDKRAGIQLIKKYL